MRIVLTPESTDGEEKQSLATREFQFGVVQIFLACQSSVRGLSIRGLGVLGIVLLLAVSAGTGVAAYFVSGKVQDYLASLESGEAQPVAPRVALADRRLAAHRRATGGQISQRLADLEQAIRHQRQALRDARESAGVEIGEMGRRIGVLQAHLVRLNALGQRLAEVSDLNAGEFDFADDPAMGGPDVEVLPRKTEVADLMDTLDQLTQHSTDNHKQLAVLESLIAGRDLAQATYPQGWPTDGGWVSSRYGYRRDPFTGRRAFHRGVDIANRSDTPIRAVASGIVTEIGTDNGYGNRVEVSHGFGFASRYAHVASVSVAPGQRVGRGEIIATMGSTGRSTGPHLHFELLENAEAVDPGEFLRAAK